MLVLAPITSHQVKLSLSNIWSLSLFNVNIKLDSLRSYLKAMSSSLSYQYKRTLEGYWCRAKAKMKFRIFNSLFSPTWKPFIMLWQRSFSFYSPPPPKKRNLWTSVHFEQLYVKFTKRFRKCMFSSQRLWIVELLWHVSARYVESVSCYVYVTLTATLTVTLRYVMLRYVVLRYVELQNRFTCRNCKTWEIEKHISDSCTRNGNHRCGDGDELASLPMH